MNTENNMPVEGMNLSPQMGQTEIPTKKSNSKLMIVLMLAILALIAGAYFLYKQNMMGGKYYNDTYMNDKDGQPLGPTLPNPNDSSKTDPEVSDELINEIDDMEKVDYADDPDTTTINQLVE